MNDIIEATKLSFEEWEEILFSPEYVRMLPNNCFPTNGIRDTYLAKIHERTEIEVRNLLRKFLIRSGYLGKDEYILEYTKTWDREKLLRKIHTIEYFRRLLTKNEYPWEGLTWVLDLLPHDPLQAIRVIDAYWYAHCQILPDYWLHGLSDCIMIIRKRYCDTVHPREILLNLTPKEFEWIVEALYKEMGYSTTLTQDSYDGGVDIIAEKLEYAQKEKILIQCKRYKKTIGIADIRELLGVVSDNKATKGVLVCSSDFSSEAQKLSENNSRIELIDNIILMKLLNQYLGAKWKDSMERIFHEKRGTPLPLIIDC